MPAEVESRYIVPDRVLFRDLLQVRQLGPFTLRNSQTVHIVDEYLDTRGKALMHQGWACRLREQDGSFILNLKGPGQHQRSVLSRPEYELTLRERVSDIATWPRGELRDRVVDLAGGLPLRRLLRIRQTRHVSLLCDGERILAHFSLDEVQTQGRGVRYRTYMCECELQGEGTIDDLERLDGILTARYMLIPEPQSKLQRALELIQTGSTVDQFIAENSQPVDVKTLMRRYEVDEAESAAQVQVAQQLFEGLMPWHEMAADTLPLLRLATQVYRVGDVGDHAQRDLVGRDILMRQPIADVDSEGQVVLAASAYLHRKGVTEERVTEVLPTSIDDVGRRQALGVASLVRIVASLSLAGADATYVEAIEEGKEGPTVMLAGPRAQRDARRANRRSDLWEMVFGVPLSWRATATAVSAEGPAGDVCLSLDDSLAMAAAKILRYHSSQMLAHEAGTIRGRDPEELHDMRVATRRMRSALRLLGPYCSGPDNDDVAERLRSLAQVLGHVRDLDVAIQNLREFASGLPQDVARTLRHLRRSLRSTRRVPRRRLLYHLRSRAYEELLESMEALLARLESTELVSTAVSSRERSSDVTHSVGHVAPLLLYLGWRQVWAYDKILGAAPVEMLHALRIDCKRLRYALEFFASVLPVEIVDLIEELKALQDHLGELHDAAVAIDMLDAHTKTTAAAGGTHTEPAGVALYRADCLAVMRDREATFAAAWRRFTCKRNKRRFRSLADADLGSD